MHAVECIPFINKTQHMNSLTAEMTDILTYHHQSPFHTEDGQVLDGYTLAFQTWGTLNEDRSNVVWIVHALTANSDPFDWWPHVVAKGGSIDPDSSFIICANVIGSPYGSTSPLSINKKTGLPYFHDFPLLTIKDMARTYEHLARHLGISTIDLLVGASMGGQQAMEWAINGSTKINNLCLIATNAKHSPFGIAFNHSQRMAIEADQSWKLSDETAGLKGLEAARSIALISYRSVSGYNTTQSEETNDKLKDFKASSYQAYQGLKLRRRFNAYSYYRFTQAMDSHNVGRGHISIADALSKISARTQIIAIDSDMLFTVEESQLLAQNIPHCQLHIISSKLGHDGFLTEHDKINQIIRQILN